MVTTSSGGSSSCLYPSLHFEYIFTIYERNVCSCRYLSSKCEDNYKYVFNFMYASEILYCSNATTTSKWRERGKKKRKRNLLYTRDNRAGKGTYVCGGCVRRAVLLCCRSVLLPQPTTVIPPYSLHNFFFVWCGFDVLFLFFCVCVCVCVLCVCVF